MEVEVCPANPPRQMKVESEIAFRTMPYVRSSQYPNRLLTSIFLFELPNPLLPEMPLRLLLGQRYPQLIGITISCTSSIIALSPTHALTANPVVSHLGWHTNSWYVAKKPKPLQQLASNVLRTRGGFSPAPNALHIPIPTEIRPGDINS
jgi:hypothetical protein